VTRTLDHVVELRRGRVRDQAEQLAELAAQRSACQAERAAFARTAAELAREERALCHELSRSTVVLHLIATDTRLSAVRDERRALATRTAALDEALAELDARATQLRSGLVHEELGARSAERVRSALHRARSRTVSLRVELEAEEQGRRTR
jgi:septal ring factor EnvC (AmiA/AmiB activator)